MRGLGVLVGVLGIALAGAALASPEEVREAERCVAQWRNPATKPEVRRELERKLLALGEEGPRRLAAAAGQEVARRRPEYLKRFEKAAAAAVRERFKDPKLEPEVVRLRQEVLTLSRSPQLTKEDIVRRADPAMERLDEVLGVAPDALLAKDKSLAAARAELVAMAAAAGAARAKVPEEKRKGLPDVAPGDEPFEEQLAAAEELAATLAMPMSDQDRAVMAANAELARKLPDAEEVRGMAIVNRIRLRLGLRALEIDVRLCEAARGHSKDMRERKFFSHDSPVAGKETPWKRAQLAGTSAGAENIYVGSRRGEEAIRGWWYSPGHHKNMLGAGHRRQGLGRDGTHWTQMFG